MLDDQDIARLKELFVLKDDCEERTDRINEKISDNKADILLIKQQLDAILWFSKAILGVVITGLGGAILALVL